MTALGDMAWYSMRAIVEYLRPQGSLTKVVAVTERDPETDAVIRASGLLAFDGGEVSTFDVGYTAGTISMEMQLLGKTGIISLSDFVLDWNSSFAFQNPEIKAGFSHRTGMQTPRETTFIATPAARGQEVLMVENFSKLVQSGDVTERARYVAATLKTQEYLDALWTAAN